MKVHVSNRAVIEDGGVLGVEWTDICRSREPFIWISYSGARRVGRWGCMPRKRNFEVIYYSRTRVGRLAAQSVGYYSDLAHAAKAAEKFVKEHEAA